MKAPITQSEAWEKLQHDLGEQSFFTRTDTYQYLAINKHTPVGNYLFLPYGPVANDLTSFKQALKSLDVLAREHHAIFTRIEPQLPAAANYLKSHQTARKTKDIDPEHTWILDLTGTEDELRPRLPSRLLRYYKRHQEKGITIETSHDPADIHYLLDLQRSLAKVKHISTFSEHYLQTELAQPFATLYLARYQDQVIAAGLVFDDVDTRYNLQGAQSDLGREFHATGILTIQLILDAAAEGKTTFDFWGIAPDGATPDHPWYGFTAFKKTFAGHAVTYAGTYDLIHHPTRYRLYQALRRLRR